MLSTKFAYPLLHIKTIGEEMAVCYYFVDWNVVYEFNVIGQSFFCLLFFFGFVCPIANSPVFNFHFFVFAKKLDFGDETSPQCTQLNT